MHEIILLSQHKVAPATCKRDDSSERERILEPELNRLAYIDHDMAE